MEDRELLELAAKAAGISPVIRFDNLLGLVIGPVSRLRYWNPLTDDGDALRLAVQLQLTVCNEHVSAGTAYCTKGENAYPEVDSGESESSVIPSDFSATRRAIVLAAAEIGKALP